jgi:hypothetical protein
MAKPTAVIKFKAKLSRPATPKGADKGTEEINSR